MSAPRYTSSGKGASHLTMEAAVSELIRSEQYKTHTVFSLTVRDEVDKQERSVWWVQKAEDPGARLDAILSQPRKGRLRRDEHPIRVLLDLDSEVRLDVEKHGDSGGHGSRFVGRVMTYLAEIAEYRREHGTLPKDVVTAARVRSWDSLLSMLEEADRDRYRYDAKARRWWYKTLKRETGARAQYLIG